MRNEYVTIWSGVQPVIVYLQWNLNQNNYSFELLRMNYTEIIKIVRVSL